MSAFENVKRKTMKKKKRTTVIFLSLYKAFLKDFLKTVVDDDNNKDI